MKRLLSIACWVLFGPVLTVQASPGTVALVEDEADTSAAAIVRGYSIERDTGSAANPRIWHLHASLADREGRLWNLHWTFHSDHGEVSATPDGKGWIAHVAITTPDGNLSEQDFSLAIDPDVEDGIFNPRAAGWEWRSRGRTLFPARLSFAAGEQHFNLLLESIETPGNEAAPVAGSWPDLLVRGFVEFDNAKDYLRGQGALGNDPDSPGFAAVLQRAGRLQDAAANSARSPDQEIPYADRK